MSGPAVAVAFRRPPFHEALERLRIKRSLSRRDIAERCGVPRAVVDSWATGEAIPEPGQFTRLRNLCFRELAPYRTDLVQQWERNPELDTSGGAAIVEVTRSPEVEHAMGEVARALEAELAAPVPMPEQAEDFGEALRRARVMEGLGQDELGELVGVTGQAVSGWETGRTAPVLEHYQGLRQLLPILERCAIPRVRDIPPPDGGKGEARAATGGKPGPQVTPYQVPRLVNGATSRPPGVPDSALPPWPGAPTLEDRLDRLAAGELPPSMREVTLAEAGEAYALALVEVERATAAARAVQAEVEAAVVALTAAKARHADAAAAADAARDRAAEYLEELRRVAAREAGAS